MVIEFTEPYVAAREAYRLWSERDDGMRKAFIYTGYIQAKKLLPIPAMTTLALTKRASYYWLGVADKLHREKGFRFLFADQRSAQGGPNNTVRPEEHAETYEEIMKNPDNFPFYVAFIDGTKFVLFEDKEE
ncbi:hypothetical protein SUNI508_05896 [Seiridium unicorne]|uniref:Uncharacterized protein n=1 Tax=Seiridium unicorne TaxID=138068 RepID=A0ABR2V381_9PEZI